MLSSAEVTRPLPPAKARKATANFYQAMTGPTNTPPPAYALSSRRGSLDPKRDILGSPMESTYRIMEWDSSEEGGYEDETLRRRDELAWVTERSKEELQELLFKADGLIREREQELGRASSMANNLYADNIALKTKRETLLSRMPMSPTPFSPEMITRTTSSGSTRSLSNLSSETPFHKDGTAKKVSAPYADLSLLEDQNAELLDKLEQLKNDASTSDLAGRRELKRLEKEISFLREALEKTQVKSEELEEKVKDVAVTDAIKKKQEREEKLRARRGFSRLGKEEKETIDFAPKGSSFGGPSTSTPLKSRKPPSSSSPTRHPATTEPEPEHALISQLLAKVKELEETNTKILQQQHETANQLNAVQRDTMNISKVYEILAEHDSLEIGMKNGEFSTPTKNRIFDDNEFHTVRFRSLKKSIDNRLQKEGPFLADIHHSGRNRKTVLGFFDEGEEEEEEPSTLVVPRSQSTMWSEDQGHLTQSNPFSSASTLLSPEPGTLSPLHVFSPLSPIQSLPAGPSLMNELDNKLGEGSWELGGQHLRNSSLYDFSQFAPSPSPSPSCVPTQLSNNHHSGHHSAGSDSTTPQNNMSNSLQLSVEPPTPSRHQSIQGQTLDVPSSFDKVASPRLQLISDTLKSRQHRWDERRLRGRRSNEAFSLSTTPTKGKQITRTRSARYLRPQPAVFPRSLSDAVEDMIDHFQSNSPGGDNGSLADESDADEWDFMDAQSDEDPESRAPTPQPPSMRSDGALRGSKQMMAKGRESTSFILQAWLWLQFLIVIFVFLFAMARKGPSAVLTRDDRKSIAGRR